MSWRSAQHTVEFWGCVNTEYAYHACILDTYYDDIEYPNKIRIRLRNYNALFS